ncbi:MAG TPA: phosphatidylglycerophosphatase A [Terriglobia bacterium]|nr:phosphatidylglycerophosphatase A [Terriglobia bacterium]
MTHSNHPAQKKTTRTEGFRFQDRLAIAVATGCGAGFMPKAPGTAGAIEGVLIYLLMAHLQLTAYFLHAIIFFLIIGTWSAYRVELFWGEDSQRIVVDEIVGQMITFGLAAGRYPLSAFYVIAGCIFFRLFDIVKPFPLRRLERFKWGVGVMADDVGAGIYALLALTLTRHILGT